MFYEMRTYRLRPGAIQTYLRLIGDEGITIQKSHLGVLVGYFHTEIGPLNEIIHIWRYHSLEDRQQRRNALAGDPAWQAFIPKIQALIETMESKILRSAPFWLEPKST